MRTRPTQRNPLTALERDDASFLIPLPTYVLNAAGELGAATIEDDAFPRFPLNRDRCLRITVNIADEKRF